MMKISTLIVICTMDSIPMKAAIDPRQILIERVYSDNTKSLVEKK